MSIDIEKINKAKIANENKQALGDYSGEYDYNGPIN
jgi:hypothetical protein